MLKVTLLKGPVDSGKTFSLLTGNSLVIGRSEGAEIRLKSKGVSKRHARLTALPGSRIEVEDLGSSNGTFVNGVMIKRHVAKVGDTIAVHDFTFAVGLRAPELPVSMSDAGGYGSPAAFDGNAALAIDPYAMPDAADMIEPAAPAPVGLAASIETFLDKNVYPLADSLAAKFDIRALIGVFFMAWSLMIIFMTILPFVEKANQRVEEQSIEVARLYARELVRVNQQAIIDQNYRELIGRLDSRSGQTKGLIDSMILDTSKAQILAPLELLGQPLPEGGAANRALAKDRESWEVTDGIATVSAPIQISGPNGNMTVAVALVRFSTVNAKFSTANMLDQVVTALLASLLVSFLFLIFVYRWVDGPVQIVSQSLDEAMKTSASTVAVPVRWPSLAALCEQITFALGRASTKDVGGSSDNEWAPAAAAASGAAAASLDSRLVVTGWNSRMESLMGIRADNAIGADIESVSRDEAFESALKALAQDAAFQPWITATREIDLGGTACTLTMVGGNGSFLINVAPVGG